MINALPPRSPGLVLDGMLVEAMAPRGGVELIVGARRDPEWGPVVMVGLGGIWTEALDDVRLMPADLARERHHGRDRPAQGYAPAARPARIRAGRHGGASPLWQRASAR